MNHQFWLSRWKQNDIGFHKSEVHHNLTRYFERLNLTIGDTLLVPLCGKTLDILWLRQRGIRVIGTELSQTAVESFFAENKMTFSRQERRRFISYMSDDLELLCGDHFKLKRSDLKGAIAAYDRAALVALSPALRVEYAKLMAMLLPTGARILLVSYAYDQREIIGPPFSVPQAEVASLFGSAFDIELLDQADTLHTHLGLKARGVTKLSEFALLLTRRAD